MSFRPLSSHAVCTQCLRHKALIQGLSGHLRARKSQQTLYGAHLRAQFLDRAQYWANRARSRMRADEVCCIADGMDQAKFAVPRHGNLKSKQLDGFQRPRLHVAALIMHGHHILVSVSEPNLRKDANTSLELVGHSLSKLQATGWDLTRTTYRLQFDNTTRELKNNVTLRFFSSLISSSKLFAVYLECLRTGHSHEDIDQLFGVLARHLVRVRDVPTSDHFVDSINEFLRGFKREHEKHRACFKLDQVRDWSHCLPQTGSLLSSTGFRKSKAKHALDRLGLHPGKASTRRPSRSPCKALLDQGHRMFFCCSGEQTQAFLSHQGILNPELPTLLEHYTVHQLCLHCFLQQAWVLKR